MITHYLSSKNKPTVIEEINRLDLTKTLWRIRVDEYDERTLEQNKKIHAMLGDIAEQSKHLNKVLDTDDWKRLCVAQFREDCIENDVARLADYWRKQKFVLMPSLSGSSLVALGTQTREFPKYVASGFVEWLLAYGSQNNIKWSDPKAQFSDYEMQRYGS